VLAEQGICLPDQLAGRRVQTSQLAVVVEGIHKVAIDNRRADHRVHRIGRVVRHPGILFSRAAPEHRGGRLVLVERQHAGAAMLRREEQVATAVHRRRDNDPHLHAVLDFPEHLSGRRIDELKPSGWNRISCRTPPALMMIGWL
jgi:hypothetical protein